MNQELADKLAKTLDYVEALVILEKDARETASMARMALFNDTEFAAYLDKVADTLSDCAQIIRDLPLPTALRSVMPAPSPAPPGQETIQ